MKSVKKVIIAILSLLPVKAIAYAVDYAKVIERPVVDQENLQEEFIQKLEDGLLLEKYYKFLEENNVLSTNDLSLRSNSKFLERLLKQYKRERVNSKLMAGFASSILPD